MRPDRRVRGRGVVEAPIRPEEGAVPPVRAGDAVHENVLPACRELLEGEQRAVAGDVVVDDGVAGGPSADDLHLRPADRHRPGERSDRELLEARGVQREELAAHFVSVRVVDSDGGLAAR